jgi:hypothetical protein
VSFQILILIYGFKIKRFVFLSKIIVNENEKSKKSSSYFSNVAKIRQEIDKSKEKLGELVKAKISLEA